MFAWTYLKISWLSRSLLQVRFPLTAKNNFPNPNVFLETTHEAMKTFPRTNMMTTKISLWTYKKGVYHTWPREIWIIHLNMAEDTHSNNIYLYMYVLTNNINIVLHNNQLFVECISMAYECVLIDGALTTGRILSPAVNYFISVDFGVGSGCNRLR